MASFISTEIIKIKDSILHLFKRDDPIKEQTDEYFKPLSNNMDNIFVKDKIVEIVHIITKDKNGHHVFNLDDLKHLAIDFIGVMALTKAIFLIVEAIVDLRIEYNNGERRELVFKLLAYIFLVTIPLVTGHNWTDTEKENVLNISLSMYHLVVTSGGTKQMLEEIIDCLRTGNCVCKLEKKARVEKYFPKIHLELTESIENAREKTRISKNNQ